MAMINNANDVLFDLCTRLKDNGVVAKVNGNYEFSEYNTPLDFVEKISELDFTEHDKRFKDEIRQLKHELEKTYNQLMEVEKDAQERIAELKSELESKVDFETDRLVKLPFDPLETANMLINATYKAEIPFLEKQVDRNVYDIDDLEQIAEHLLVYCKHNKDSEE